MGWKHAESWDPLHLLVWYSQHTWVCFSSRSWQKDEGFITNHTALPIKGFSYTHLPSESRAKVEIGPLLCQGEKPRSDIGTSCESLRYKCLVIACQPPEALGLTNKLRGPDESTMCSKSSCGKLSHCSTEPTGFEQLKGQDRNVLPAFADHFPKLFKFHRRQKNDHFVNTYQKCREKLILKKPECTAETLCDLTLTIVAQISSLPPAAAELRGLHFPHKLQIKRCSGLSSSRRCLCHPCVLLQEICPGLFGLSRAWRTGEPPAGILWHDKVISRHGEGSWVDSSEGELWVRHVLRREVRVNSSWWVGQFR